jgi:outer membrane protein assembly factor BamB
VRSRGLSGRVSVEAWTTKTLPHADNLVNLVVVEEDGGVPMSEIMRVLAPRGVAYVKAEDTWTRIEKPWPDTMDEWPQFLHDATGNAVSDDSVVGPPRHMQWVAGPRSARGHENLGSLSVAVSSRGRIFYIADGGPIASVALPSDWQLIARDAFNGVLLWKRSIPEWEWRLRPFRSGPPQLHRRLVSIDDTVYVTLGYGAPLTALDAATGQITKTYDQTAGTEEIVYAEGVLYLVVGNPEDQAQVDTAVRRGQPLPAVSRRIMAVDAERGSIRWQTDDAALPELFALTLCVDGGRVFFQTTEEVVALDASNGNDLWRVSRPADLRRRAWASPTLVVYEDVLITADQTPRASAGDTDGAKSVAWDVTMAGGGKDGEMAAYSVETGELLWAGPCRQTYNAPPDLLIVDDLLWSGRLIGAREPGITQALDPRTGQVKRTRPADQEFFNVGMGHHRCYRNKATRNYLVLGRSGVEYVNLATGDAEAHHWVRGTCQHGVVPCNGLTYITPHTCGCFIKAKLNGLNALAPASVSRGRDTQRPRWERGPAFGQASRPPSPASRTSDWPTYRHDAARSGRTARPVDPELALSWQADLGGRPSAVTIADGRVFVSQIDAHTVHALDAQTGQIVWSKVVGGRVDSPPTIDRGMAIFGCADGWVYCLRASDGQLAWRLRAAPGQRRVVSFDRLESAWPVSGSVLVLDGVVYCAAGRSSFLDGGISLCRIDTNTGELLSETLVSGYDLQTGKQAEWAVRPRGTEMPGALPDVLSSDGQSIFMRHCRFDRLGVEVSELIPHLFSSVGFLDDTWWHRSYWMWAANSTSGWGGWHRAGNQAPSGRLLVTTDQNVYGFGRNIKPTGNAGQWRTGEYYHYFAASKQPTLASSDGPSQPANQKPAKKRRPKPAPRVDFLWSQQTDREARALVMAGDTLFAAGPLGQAHRSLPAFEGKEGVRLWAMSAVDGQSLSELEIESLPVHDGLAAAGGKLYLATNDGKVMCFGSVP